MDSLTFLVVSLLSGAIAGTISGLVNLALVEPYLDKAIQIEVQNGIKKGEQGDPVEHVSYRLWQKGGEIVAGTILGMSYGALLGIVFVFARKILPDSKVKKAIVLAGVIWLVVFFVPALKYPANPPTVGDPNTINYRESLFITLIFISGLTALGLAIVHSKWDAKPLVKFSIISVIYGITMIGAFIAIPSNPDKIDAPIDLVNEFRIISILTITMFWLILGVLFGVLWDRLKPQEAQVRST